MIEPAEWSLTTDLHSRAHRHVSQAGQSAVRTAAHRHANSNPARSRSGCTGSRLPPWTHNRHSLACQAASGACWSRVALERHHTLPRTHANARCARLPVHQCSLPCQPTALMQLRGLSLRQQRLKLFAPGGFPSARLLPVRTAPRGRWSGAWARLRPRQPTCSRSGWCWPQALRCGALHCSPV